MGQEIETLSFDAAAFARFRSHLAEETQLLAEWVRAGAIAEAPYVVGFELEAWLVDHSLFPSPINEAYLAALANPLVVPELSRFNVELNGTPQPLVPGALLRLEREFEATWRHCVDVAHDLDASLVMIGILPTIREADLCLANMSPLNRYHALNEQVMRARHGRAIPVDIAGREHLLAMHRDVMMEAATTSFQVHLQVPASRAARYYNASLILSGPIVAASGNSPVLFGRNLWDETRIPLFEQAVATGAGHNTGRDATHRVTFGSGYVRESVLECFVENESFFPCLLPMHFPDGAPTLEHLRLHNGTIWRWNRPLVGFDAQGTPHFRIEHRTLPSGPSVLDMMANAALYVGLVHHLANREIAPESRLSFEHARENFYRAAHEGLTAQLTWIDGTVTHARTLLLDELLPAARDGLVGLGLEPDEIDRYLEVIEARVRSGQTGAEWQRQHLNAHGRDLFELTSAYLEHQRSSMPVHEWEA
jgi:hypothetical protein